MFKVKVDSQQAQQTADSAVQQKIEEINSKPRDQQILDYLPNIIASFSHIPPQEMLAKLDDFLCHAREFLALKLENYWNDYAARTDIPDLQAALTRLSAPIALKDYLNWQIYGSKVQDLYFLASASRLNKLLFVTQLQNIQDILYKNQIMPFDGRYLAQLFVEMEQYQYNNANSINNVPYLVYLVPVPVVVPADQINATQPQLVQPEIAQPEIAQPNPEPGSTHSTPEVALASVSAPVPIENTAVAKTAAVWETPAFQEPEWVKVANGPQLINDQIGLKTKREIQKNIEKIDWAKVLNQTLTTTETVDHSDHLEQTSSPITPVTPSAPSAPKKKRKKRGGANGQANIEEFAISAPANPKESTVEQLEEALNNFDYAGWNNLVAETDLCKPFVVGACIGTINVLIEQIDNLLLKKFSLNTENKLSADQITHAKDFLRNADLKYPLLIGLVCSEQIDIEFKKAALEGLCSKADSYDFFAAAAGNKIFDRLADIKNQEKDKGNDAYYQQLLGKIIAATKRNKEWLDTHVNQLLVNLSQESHLDQEAITLLGLLKDYQNNFGINAGKTLLMLALKHVDEKYKTDKSLHPESAPAINLQLLEYLWNISNFSLIDKSGKNALHYWALYFNPNFSQRLIAMNVPKWESTLYVPDSDSQTFMHYLVSSDATDDQLSAALETLRSVPMYSQLGKCFLHPNAKGEPVIHILDSRPQDCAKSIRIILFILAHQIVMGEILQGIEKDLRNALATKNPNYITKRLFYVFGQDPLFKHVQAKNYDRALKILERRDFYKRILPEYVAKTKELAECAKKVESIFASYRGEFDLFEQIMPNSDRSSLYSYIVNSLALDKSLFEHAKKFITSEVFFKYETQPHIPHVLTLMWKMTLAYSLDPGLDVQEYLPFIEAVLRCRDTLDCERKLPQDYAMEQSNPKLVGLLIGECTPQTMHTFNQKITMNFVAKVAMRKENQLPATNIRNLFSYFFENGESPAKLRFSHENYNLNALYLPIALNDPTLLSLFDSYLPENECRRLLMEKTPKFDSLLGNAKNLGRIYDSIFKEIIAKEEQHKKKKTDKLQQDKEDLIGRKDNNLLIRQYLVEMMHRIGIEIEQQDAQDLNVAVPPLQDKEIQLTLNELSKKSVLDQEQRANLDKILAHQNSTGRTPVMLALINNQENTETALLEYLFANSDTNTKDNYGRDMLHYWALYYNPRYSLKLIKPIFSKLELTQLEPKSPMINLDKFQASFLYYLAQSVDSDDSLSAIFAEFSKTPFHFIVCLLYSHVNGKTILHVLDSRECDFPKAIDLALQTIVDHMPQVVRLFLRDKEEWVHRRFFYAAKRDPLLNHLKHEQYERILTILERRYEFRLKVSKKLQDMKIADTQQDVVNASMKFFGEDALFEQLVMLANITTSLYSFLAYQLTKKTLHTLALKFINSDAFLQYEYSNNIPLRSTLMWNKWREFASNPEAPVKDFEPFIIKLLVLDDPESKHRPVLDLAIWLRDTKLIGLALNQCSLENVHAYDGKLNLNVIWEQIVRGKFQKTTLHNLFNFMLLNPENHAALVRRFPNDQNSINILYLPVIINDNILLGIIYQALAETPGLTKRFLSASDNEFGSVYEIALRRGKVIAKTVREAEANGNMPDPDLLDRQQQNERVIEFLAAKLRLFGMELPTLLPEERKQADAAAIASQQSPTKVDAAATEVVAAQRAASSRAPERVNHGPRP